MSTQQDLEALKNLDKKENLPGELSGQGVGFSPKNTLESLKTMESGVNKQVEAGLSPKQTEVLGKEVIDISDKQAFSELEIRQMQSMGTNEILGKIDKLSEKELWELGKKLDVVWANEQNKTLISNLAQKIGLSNEKALKVMIANHSTFSQLFGEKNGPNKTNLLENKFGSQKAGFEYLTGGLKSLIDRSYADASVIYEKQNNGASLSQYDYYKNAFEAIGPDIHQYYYANGLTGTWRNEYLGSFMPAYREAYKGVTKQFAGY